MISKQLMWLIPLFAVAQALPLPQVHDMDLIDIWADWKLEFGKQYSSQQDKERYEQFTRNLKELIVRQELEPHAAFHLDHTADWSDLDWRDIACSPPNTTGYTVTVPHVSAEEATLLEDLTIDWTRTPYVSSVKMQIGGTCWAHAATGCVEGAWAQSRSSLPRDISLSAQQMIDCSGYRGPYGMDYVIYNPGINSNALYPLADRDPYCDPVLSRQAVGHITRTGCLHNGGPEVDILRQLQEGPMAISVAANPIAGYRDGILTKQCGDGNINHAVLLVGYGQENGVRYWKLKNSWGESWGEKGFWRMQYGVNCLQLADGGPCSAWND